MHLTRVGTTPRRWRSLHGGLIILGFLPVATVLAACNLTGFSEETRAPDVTDRIRSLDLLPRDPRPQEPNGNVPDRRQPIVYEGTKTEGFEGPEPQPRPSGRSDGYELNFENTPVASVAKVILGDILGVGYTIDPRVQGTISLASGRPVPKSDMLFVLESALRISNVVLVRDTAGYRLVPLGEAIGAGNIDSDPAFAEPGYGISVVPLQHISAQTLIKLLDSFATKAGAVRADVGRNMLLIQGSGPERRAAIETVLSFDAEWLRGQSVGIFPIHNGTPEPIIAELEKIVDSGEGGLSQSMIKFQPISRMNSILVVTRKPELLKTASNWISRLDSVDSQPTGVRVYRLRYGEARQMARVLNEIFVGASSTALDSATNQLAPGSGASVTSNPDQPSLGGSGFGSQSAANSR